MIFRIISVLLLAAAPIEATLSSMSELEYQMFVLTNAVRLNPNWYRTTYGASVNCQSHVGKALVLNKDAIAAAYAHSEYMAMSNCFSQNDCKCGACDFYTRLAKVGFDRESFAENIGIVQTNPVIMMNTWLSTTEDCLNIFSSKYTGVGIAVVKDKATRIFVAESEHHRTGFGGIYLDGVLIAFSEKPGKVYATLEVTQEKIELAGANGLFHKRRELTKCTKFIFESEDGKRFPESGSLVAACDGKWFESGNTLSVLPRTNEPSPAFNAVLKDTARNEQITATSNSVANFFFDNKSFFSDQKHIGAIAGIIGAVVIILAVVIFFKRKYWRVTVVDESKTSMFAMNRPKDEESAAFETVKVNGHCLTSGTVNRSYSMCTYAEDDEGGQHMKYDEGEAQPPEAPQLFSTNRRRSTLMSITSALRKFYPAGQAPEMDISTKLGSSSPRWSFCSDASKMKDQDQFFDTISIPHNFAQENASQPTEPAKQKSVLSFIFKKW